MGSKIGHIPDSLRSVAANGAVRGRLAPECFGRAFMSQRAEWL